MEFDINKKYALLTIYTHQKKSRISAGIFSTKMQCTKEKGISQWTAIYFPEFEKIIPSRNSDDEYTSFILYEGKVL